MPTDAQQSCFERILKFTLKQPLHVSVQSPSSGSVLFELAKVIVIKILVVDGSFFILLVVSMSCRSVVAKYFRRKLGLKCIILLLVYYVLFFFYIDKYFN
jgi:hypothetical protein